MRVYLERARARTALVKSVTAAALVALWARSAPAAAAEERQRDFTAQSKPKVTVLKFENTNKKAQDLKYGESVSAMLVTYLKRKSQLIIVERADLDVLEREVAKVSSGATQDKATDSKLLEGIDAFLQGKVTVIEDGGLRTEIDAKLIGKDARILAVASQSGPDTCLRQTVETLAVALENQFLKPYFGDLTIAVPEPKNVRVFLTPLLPDNPKKDEELMIELDRSVSSEEQEGLNVYTKWVTDAGVCTIKNLLSGWYAIKLKRPGYAEIKGDGGSYRCDRIAGLPHRVNRPGEPVNDPMLVNIERLQEARWPRESGQIKFRKLGGSLSFEVKREFVDRDYRAAEEVEGLRTFVTPDSRIRTEGGKPDEADERMMAAVLKLARVNDSKEDEGARKALTAAIDLNLYEDLLLTDFDTKCFTKVPIPPRLAAAKGCEAPSAGLSIPTFTGGNLRIVDYHKVAEKDRTLPTGQYQVQAWYTGYEARIERGVSIVDKQTRPVQIDLRRQRGTLSLDNPGPANASWNILLEGAETGQKRAVPLNFSRNATASTKASPSVEKDLPVDRYTVTTTAPGFGGWKKTLFVLPYQEKGPEAGDGCDVKPADLKPVDRRLTLKVQPWLAGRTDSMNRYKDADFYSADSIRTFLLGLMDEEEKRYQAEQRTAQEKRQMLPAVSEGRTQKGGDEEEGLTRLELLRLYLGDVDLLYLDDSDMGRIRKVPRLAQVIREYVDHGGALIAFVSQPGSYGDVFGAPLEVLADVKSDNDLELHEGDVPEVSFEAEVKLTADHNFPLLSWDKGKGLPGWRTLAYRRKKKDPVIVERGDPQTGGYVAVWLNNEDFILKEDRIKDGYLRFEQRAAIWARYLAFRRYGQGSQELENARQQLSTVKLRFRTGN